MDQHGTNTDKDTEIVVSKLRRSQINQSLVDTLSALSPVDADIKLLMRRFHLWNSRKYVCVAHNQPGEIVGYGSILFEYKPTRDILRPVGHIEDITVREDWQRRGVGTAIMQHLIAVSKEHKCRKLILSCSLDKKGFYEQLGFSINAITMRFDL